MAKGRIGAKRKCQRCKEVFVTVDKLLMICEKCRNSCTRCAGIFTQEDTELIYRQKNGKSSKAKPKLMCIKCRNELARLGNLNPEYKAREKDYRLYKTFGITFVEYQAILDSQGGVCWICKKPPGKTLLHVDHKHEKGEKKRDAREKRARVRGLLCWKCNTSIAKFRDDPVLLRAAADYVEKWPAQEILKEPK